MEDRSSLRSNGLIRSTISRTHGTYPPRSKILSTGYVLWRLDRWGGSLTRAFNIISVQLDLFNDAIRSPPTLIHHPFFPFFPFKTFRNDANRESIRADAFNLKSLEKFKFRFEIHETYFFSTIKTWILGNLQGPRVSLTRNSKFPSYEKMGPRADDYSYLFQISTGHYWFPESRYASTWSRNIGQQARISDRRNEIRVDFSVPGIVFERSRSTTFKRHFFRGEGRNECYSVDSLDRLKKKKEKGKDRIDERDP